MDNLEDFIKNNKEGFEQKAPKNLWDNIESKLEEKPPVKKKTNWLFYGSVAAGIALLITVGIQFGKQKNNTVADTNQPVQQIQEKETQIALADISEEYAELELHYITEISEKEEALLALNPDEELMEEIKMLDDDYKMLSKELGSGGDDKIIVEAMIENYRLKIELMDVVIEELKTATA